MNLVALPLLLALAGPEPTDAEPPPLPSAWTAPVTGDDTGIFGAAQLFTGVDVSWSPASDVLRAAFDVERAELGGGFVWERTASAVIRLEAVRSAGPQSAFGIDGDSLLPRFRLAYAAWTPRFALWDIPVAVTARAGLIPEPWIEGIEAWTSTRGLLPIPTERARLFDTSDVGASATVTVADGIVDASVAVTNGEGKAEVEQNAGKNVTATIGVRPLRASWLGDSVDVGARAGYRDGTIGLASIRNHRAMAAAFVAHPLFHLGAEGAWAFGVDRRAEREAVVAGAWADAQVIPSWLGLVARYDLTVTDLAAPDAREHAVLGGVFCDLGRDERLARGPGGLVRRLRVYLAVDQRIVEGGAGPLPGAPDAGNLTRALVLVEVNGVSDVFNPIAVAPSASAAEAR